MGAQCTVCHIVALSHCCSTVAEYLGRSRGFRNNFDDSCTGLCVWLLLKQQTSCHSDFIHGEEAFPPSPKQGLMHSTEAGKQKGFDN